MIAAPDYREAQGGQTLTADEESIRFWESLYKDPFYEIRLLGLRPLQDETLIPGTMPPAQRLEASVEALSESDELRVALDRLGIGAVFDDAVGVITGPASKPYERLLDTASNNLSEDYAAIARAIVSASRILCKEQEIYPWLLVSDTLRDEAVEAIRQIMSAGNVTGISIAEDFVVGEYVVQ